MSEATRNKQQVRLFFETANRDGFGAAIATLADDCRWWTSASLFTKTGMAALAEQLGAHLSEPFTFETGHVTAEEDRVAIEARNEKAKAAA